MNSIEALTQFFGWCSVINFGILILATTGLFVFRSSILKIHTKLLGLTEKELLLLYAQYLSQYKIAIFVLNVAPYFALKTIG